MNGKIVFNEFCELMYMKVVSTNFEKVVLPNNLYLDLISEISNTSLKVLITLMQILIDDNVIYGTNYEEYYTNFNNYSKSEKFYNMLNEYFPILVKKLNFIISSRIDDYLKLQQRYNKDLKEIKSIFQHEFECFSECNIKGNVSDTHNGSQNYIIESNNISIVYKGRDSYIDKFWNTILNWINCKINEDLLPNINVINSKNYSWHQYIEYDKLDDYKKIAKYYRQLGFLACLAYILDISDLHMENIICSKKGPVIVDLETIFQVNISPHKTHIKIRGEYFENLISKSVLKTALFPVSNLKSNSKIDFSGICGHGGQTIQKGICKINNPFSKDFEFKLENGILGYKKNIPQLNGKYVDPKMYLNSIICGFSECYNIVMNNKDEFFKLIFKNKEIDLAKLRVVFHDTQSYQDIINYSTLPTNCTSDGITQIYRSIENMCSGLNDSIKKDILTNVLHCSIPIYHGKFKDQIVTTSDGEKCYQHDCSPYIQLENKLNSLSEQDYKFQKQLIELSMLGFRDKTFNKEFTIGNKPIKQYFINNSLLDGEILRISNKIIDKAEYDDSGFINWLTIENNYPNWKIKFLDCSFYSGLSGIALFFGALYKITGDQKYKLVLDRILSSISRFYMSTPKSPSPFIGTMSVTYLYLYLYRQDFGEQYYYKAVEIIYEHEEEIKKCEHYDFFDGLSGVLIILLRANKIKENKRLANLIKQVYIKLRDNIYIKNDGLYWGKEKILIGLAHGAAGITYALVELYLQRFDKEVLRLIKLLIAYENSYFNLKESNWSDIRYESDKNEDTTVIQWCHGAVGIGLSRIRTNQLMDVSNDIKKAKNIILKKGLYKENDSICHGNFGNISFLIEQYKITKDKEIKRIINIRINEIIDNNNGTYKSGISKDFESVDFMLGLSGIGYQFLKLKSDDVPIASLLEI